MSIILCYCGGIIKSDGEGRGHYSAAGRRIYCEHGHSWSAKHILSYSGCKKDIRLKKPKEHKDK